MSRSYKEEILKQGKGSRPNAAEALSEDEINILYEKSLLGISKRRSIDKHSLALQFTSFRSTRLCRASANARGGVQLMKDADETEHLHFSNRQTKTRRGADSRNVRPIKSKALATPDLDLQRERDLGAVLKINCEKRPVHEC